MFATLDIFTIVISRKVGVLLYKHSAILSEIALFPRNKSGGKL